MKRLLLLAALCLPLGAQTAINDTLYLQGATPWTGQVTVSWPAFTSCTGTPIARGSRVSPVNAGVVAISLWASDCASPSFAYSATYRTMGGANHGQTWTETWVVPSSPSIVTLATVRQTSTLTAKPLAHASTHASGGSDPVTLTKTQVGLGNVDNTSDASKPVSAAQQAALDLKATAANPTFTGTVSISKTVLGLPGGVCDGVADDTAALQVWLNVNSAAGGTLIVPNGKTCRIDGQITIPFATASPYAAPPFRITGEAAPSYLQTDELNFLPSALPVGGSVLDLRYAGNRILAYGSGTLELDHLTITNQGTSCGTFLYSTLTSVKLHDNAIYGSSTNPVDSCDDIWVAGGTKPFDVTINANDPNQYFQGYNSSVLYNFADRIRRLVYGRVAFNGVMIQGNVVYWRSGSKLTTPITAATNANPAVLTAVDEATSRPIYLTISGFTGSWAAANGRWLATGAGSTNTFTIPVNSTGFGPMTGTPVFLSGAIIDIDGRYSNNADVMAVSNVITGNILQIKNYAHGVTLHGAHLNNVTGNSCGDAANNNVFVSCYRADFRSNGNLFSATDTGSFLLAGPGDSKINPQVNYNNPNAIQWTDDTGAVSTFFNFDSDLRARWRDARFGFAWRTTRSTDDLQINPSGVQIGPTSDPGCNAGNKGILRYSGHTAGVKDTVAICAADATDTYAWRTIY